MLTDLERDLRDAFAREAADVDLPAPEWAGARPFAAPRRSRRLVAVAAAAVAAAGIGVALVGPFVGRSWHPPTSPRRPCRPASRCSCSRSWSATSAGRRPRSWSARSDRARSTPTPSTASSSSSSRRSSIAAAPVSSRFVASRTRQRRLSCRPIGERPLAISAASLGVWTDLPAGTAFVTARTADGPRWQRPVDGVAAFPARASLQALDSEGRVLARLDQEQALLDDFDVEHRGCRLRLARLGRQDEGRRGGDLRRAALPGRPRHRHRPPRPGARRRAARAPVERVPRTSQMPPAHRRFTELGGRLVSDPADDPTWSEEAWRRGDVEVTCVVAPGGGETCRLHLPVSATGG